MKIPSMCPHCGEVFEGWPNGGLIPTHDYPKPGRAVCPGSQQNPRNPLTDGRPLWNDEPNMNFYRNLENS